ncbi:5714_t:CDS:2, partial [Acaulospora colombiana]
EVPLTNQDRFKYKHTCLDPKDSELCLNRIKSEETLVEARSNSDVQIDCRIWVWDFLDTGGEKLPSEAWTPGLEDFGLGEKSPVRYTLNNQLRTDTNKGNLTV